MHSLHRLQVDNIWQAANLNRVKHLLRDWVFKHFVVSEFEREMVKKMRVPDASGGIRYCTACDSFIPVGKFPLGPRRYTRKKHSWDTAGKKAKAKRMADTNKRILTRLWEKAYDDSKRFSRAWITLEEGKAESNNHAHVKITQREIEQLLFTATDYSSKEVFDNPMEFASRIAVIPVNPREVLSLSNAALVPSPVKRRLFRAFTLDGLAGYTNTFSEAGRRTKSGVFLPSQEQIKTMHSAMNSILESGCARYS